LRNTPHPVGIADHLLPQGEKETKAKKMTKQFWVIGGEYKDADFNEIEEGSHRTYGPFFSYEDANVKWKSCSEGSRSQAYTRYQIVASAHNPQRPSVRQKAALAAIGIASAN
jgi:hypothetical protein